MKFLLDTCTLIWFFEGSEQIDEALQRRLVDPKNDVRLSDVSLLEIVIKHRMGKFPLPIAPSRLLPALAKKHRLESLPISRGAIFELESLPLLHRDPFDRLLIGQALNENYTLVTPDPLIRQYSVSVLWI
ncbi:MAG TPA: type II toxin-antitoxin system VapC family toxin [Terriglobales bacterium]